MNHFNILLSTSLFYIINIIMEDHIRNEDHIYIVHHKIKTLDHHLSDIFKLKKLQNYELRGITMLRDI